MGYQVIVKIADIGARYVEDNGTIGHSLTGHVWLTLVNGQTGEEFNFGFHPSEEGKRKTDPGLVRTDDYRYLDVAYQRSLAISADEFNNIYNICQMALAQNTFGTYSGGWNACPDFALKVLWQAGIGIKSAGFGFVYDTVQKAFPLPMWNIGIVKEMADYNDKFIAPALSRNGLDARDVDNRINVTSNVSNTQFISSDLITSIVTKQAALHNSPGAYYIETAGNIENITRRAVRSDELGTTAENLKLGETLVCIAGNNTTYLGIQQATGVTGTTLQTMNNTDTEQIQVGQRLVVANNNPITSSINLTTPSMTFAQKLQYNFQTILGPSNSAFIDAILNNQDIEYNFRLEYNPNEVLWRVNAVGTPHPYDYENLLEQNRVIEAATNQTITEMQDSRKLPMTGSLNSNLA